MRGCWLKPFRLGQQSRDVDDTECWRAFAASRPTFVLGLGESPIAMTIEKVGKRALSGWGYRRALLVDKCKWTDRLALRARRTSEQNVQTVRPQIPRLSAHRKYHLLRSLAACMGAAAASRALGSTGVTFRPRPLGRLLSSSDGAPPGCALLPIGFQRLAHGREGCSSIPFRYCLFSRDQVWISVRLSAYTVRTLCAS
jgi:hypothetical protein